VSPSLVVATPGAVHHRLVKDEHDPRGEPVAYMARAALLLASEPCQKVSGRVTYSQELLHEYGEIERPRGLGAERAGSGYSKI